MSLNDQEDLQELVFDEAPQDTVEELPELVFDEATPVAPEAVESNAMWDLVEDTAKQTLVDNALAVIPNFVLLFIFSLLFYYFLFFIFSFFFFFTFLYFFFCRFFPFFSFPFFSFCFVRLYLLLPTDLNFG